MPGLATARAKAHVDIRIHQHAVVHNHNFHLKKDQKTITFVSDHSCILVFQTATLFGTRYIELTKKKPFSAQVVSHHFKKFEYRILPTTVDRIVYTWAFGDKTSVLRLSEDITKCPAPMPPDIIFPFDPNAQTGH